MKLIPVEAVPKRRGRHHLQDLIEEFVKGDAEVVQIDFSDHDYKSAQVCRSCLGVATKKSGHPIKVSLREGVVYLSKM
ncbi:hypothetical protein [uncultured Oscillibacter sp.]|mgnify:CR=1 FL=1|uniref:hypothetical protein n=1 Tax=uncultured Oscillibacter sp. TaxID=876091 RepID=UPI0025DD9A38|nr:hypothetical protein [uncultured Oscillibacter sp.]